ncbi:MAG TPA: hypothetical protein VHW01_13360, partial [Polyangiaceae bacterium]|nr:hypothetical protein [Polyangiaceae bacterium]
LGSSLLGTAACNGCGSEKPYTPFGVASSSPSAVQAPSGAPEIVAPAAPSAGFAARKAELVPGAPEAWQSAGLDLKAPDARRFAQVLPGDFDGDQKPDALAWLVPAPHEKNAPPGELWYFPNGAPARKLCALPGFVPSGPDCTLSPTLTQTGSRSATLDVSAVCKAPLISRAPARAIVVVSPSVEPAVLLTLRAASAAANETLVFSVDSSDQDQDGRDDVRLTLSVGALGSAEPASADLAWLDRAAGSSRSASEPITSLTRFAAHLVSRARIKHSSYRPETTGNAVRLLSSLCAESGAARIFNEEGSAFRCGDLTRIIDSLAEGELSYALAQGDVLEAFSVLRRDGWYFRGLSVGARKSMERDLLRSVTKLDLDPPFVARAQATLPQLPHYSPLWFEADGALLIRGANSVTRVAANRGAEDAASGDGGVASWPLELAAANGERVTGTSHACDRSELLFNVSDAQRGLLSPLTTRLLAARPASCAGHGTGPAVSIVPLGFDDQGLDALVNGSRVTSAAAGQKQPASIPALGTPRSPDGRWLITPSALGLLLIGDHKELWQTSALHEHADASKFTDCVVANDARAAACIDAGRVIVFERGKPSVTSTKK